MALNNKNKNDLQNRINKAKEKNKNNNSNNNNKKKGFNNFSKPPLKTEMFAIIMMIALFLYMFSGGIQNYFITRQEVTYTEFVNDVKRGKFREIVEKDNEITATVKENGKDVIYSTRKITSRIGDDQNLMNLASENNVSVSVARESSYGTIFYIILNLLPYLFMFFIFFMITRMNKKEGGIGGSLFSTGKSRAKKLEKKLGVTFDDVAGVDGAKEELKEIVDFLKDANKYRKAGARVPKGVLLLGRPGTGKTLLAKAVAGESGASFFSLSGSEFIEMFVGVGASRVRDVFEKAKAESPSIIFIDEIDAIGRRRSSGRSGGGNEEREQTLNQLLVEMDGFETDTKVIVIAATNREDILDPALLRSGRFDRRVMVDAPDVQGRIAILKVHAKNKKLSDNVKLEDIAKVTPGFVGADLENLLNEAAILAARNNSDTITMEDLDEAVDKIGMGLGQKSKIMKPEEKKLLAYHEAGHAVVSELTEGADPVHKVTIIPRGSAGGYMMPLLDERLVKTGKEMLAEIKVCFGGRAAEEIVLGDVSTGAYSDIKTATRIARQYVESVGLSDLGPVNYENPDYEYSVIPNKSNETVREIDMEIRAILNREYENTVNLLKENRDKLEGIAELLLKKETITGYEVREIISGKSINDILNTPENEINSFESKDEIEKNKEEKENLLNESDSSN